MKQETGKTKKKWLLPAIIAAVVLVIVGVVLAIFLKPQGPGEETGTQSKLYWNVDREENLDPETGMSIRKPGDDGLYTIRFAVDGEQVEYKCADKRLVTNMDFLDVMGLAFDADGLIVEVLQPTDVAKEIAKKYFVRSFDGTNLVLNSSMAMNGMAMTLKVTENTGIYDVTPEAQVIGERGTVDVLDMVTVYGTEEDEITHIYRLDRAIEADVYYRLHRMYDKVSNHTTREPDENGVYTIEYAYKGQLVDLKCKNRELVNEIDYAYDALAIMGLIFDDEGYIVDIVSAEEAIKGQLLYSKMTVTGIDGETVTVESKYYANADLGVTDTLYVSGDCDIYMLEADCGAHHIGEATDHLEVGDRCYIYADMEGNPKMIFVERRVVDSPMYYNIAPKYDSTTKETTRIPENGYYVYEMAVGGKQVTLKTKNKELANRIDGMSSPCMGLKCNGSIIEAVYDASCVTGLGSTSDKFVTDVMGGIVRLVQPTDLKSGNSYLMAPDVEIYDVTNNCKVPFCSVTEIQPFDRLTVAFLNEDNQITHMYINQRYEEDAQFVFCADRQYNTETQETTRIPDADGYYVYQFASEGKQITAKTKDKDIANWIDKYSSNAPIAAKISGGIIKAAYKPETAVKYGRITMGNSEFQVMHSNNTFDYISYRGNLETSPFPISKNCGIYNCTTVYDEYRGEKTTLRKGDLLYIIASYESNQIEKLLITNGRYHDGPLYWHVDRQYNFTTKQTTREPDADGWYKIPLIVDGTIKTFKTKDKMIASAVDARSSYFSVVLDGDIIKCVVEYIRVANIDKPVYAGYTVTAVKGDTITVTDLRGGQETYGDEQTLELTKDCRIYDISSYAENYGGKVKLVPGDDITPIADDNGKISYVYVNAKNRREAGFITYCEHCDKEVMWVAYTGSVNKADTHYYLPTDLSTVQIKVGYDDTAKEKNPDWKPFDIVMDLNGNTLSSATYRAFFVYTGSLSIMDSVGTGKIVAGNMGGGGGAIRASGDVTVNIYGGTIMPDEAQTPHTRGALFYGSDSILNIYGGTLIGGTVQGDVTTGTPGGGAIFASGGKINIYGGTIKDGVGLKNEFGNGRGGNIWAYNSELNIYGGTIENGSATRSGGNIHVDDGKFNLYGGTITGGVSVDVSGDLFLNNAESNIAGGTITGGVSINSDLFTTFSGSPVLSGKLAIPAGIKVILGDLKEGASIRVSAEGVFTAENENAAEYKNYFKPSRVFDTVTEVGGALVYTKYEVDGNTIDNSNLVFDEGTTKALCPACGEVVTWIALDQETYAENAYGSMSDGDHLYLAEDITYTGTDIFATAPSTGLTGCIHLNGHNLTTPATKTLNGNAGTLNIMGNGTVTGYGSAGTRGAAVSINTTSANGRINVYGGTYGQTAESVGFTVCIEDNGGQINLYKAVTVNGNARYRGVRVGTADRADAVLGLYGATLNSRLTIEGADGTAARDIVTIDGATINARVDIYKESTVTLSGKVIVTDGLNLIENALVELGELTEGSNIKVYPTDVFTVLNEKAPDYVGYFFALNGEDSIKLTEDNLALRYVPYVFDGNAVSNENLVFAPGTTNAKCEICNKVVTWTPITAADIGTGMTMTDRHYYLAETISLNNSSIDFILTVPTDGTVCLHLNGKDLINAVVGDSHYAIGNRGKLSILGNGLVHGDGRAYHGGAVAMMNSKTNQELNLFGGTYDDQNSRAVSAVAGGGVINVYRGATLNDAIQVQAGDSYTGSNAVSVNIYGGTFNANIALLSAGTVAGSGTPLNIYGGIFNTGRYMVADGAGTATNEEAKSPVNIYGGSFTYSDNLAASDTVNLQVYGGTFSKDPSTYVAEGYEVTETEGVFAVAQKNA